MLEHGKPLNPEDVYSIGILSEAWFAEEFFNSTLPEEGFTLSHETQDFYYHDPEKETIYGHLPDFMIAQNDSPITIAVEVTISRDLSGKRRQRKVMRAHVDTTFVEFQVPLKGLENLNLCWELIKGLAHGAFALPLEQDQLIGPLLIIGKHSLHEQLE